MDCVSPDLDLFELLVGHFDPGFIFVRVEDRLDFESGARLGAANQIDDRLIVD
jgi:hypothetical protein